MKINNYLIIAGLALTSFMIPKYTLGQEKNAAIELSDSRNFVQLKASYNKSKTRQVQQYMTTSLKETGFKFTNAQLDADLTLTGGINFYIKSYLGELVLKFDKRKNNTNDYTKFKKMCEGIKSIVQQN
jgi:hypothetical protein